MPTKTLGQANVKFKNITIPKADQHLLNALPPTVDIVDATGARICRATKNKANGMGDYRMACPSLFAHPLPTSVCTGQHVLGVGDTFEWDVSGSNFVLKSVAPAGASATATATPVHVVQSAQQGAATAAGTMQSPIGFAMNFCALIVNLRLVPVHTFLNASQIVKGGKKKNHELCQNCSKVTHKRLCYYWKSGGKVLYIGSATPYKNQSSSILGRMLNYLQNHTSSKKGVAHVNKRVFAGAKTILQSANIEFGIFEFDFLALRDRTLTFSECEDKSHITEMLEYALISYYKLRGEAIWNM
ncbi:MAG: hypothetical protein H7831_18315 [Magnetococcus sp. WYHC-3]